MIESIGERIKSRRKALKLSVDELATTIGINRATIYRYESNEIENMSITILEPLSKALHTTPAELCGWDTLPSGLVLSASEKNLLKKYKKLNSNGKEYINEQFDFALSQDKYRANSETEETPIMEEDAASSA